MNDQNVMELRAIPDLMRKNYFIPEYQRGYRWESSQVNQLLDDLLAYFEDSRDNASFYCLQPIVVKVCDEETKQINNLGEDVWYEVIDGQQRLTTIRILCALYDSMEGTPNKHRFEIRYSTRPDMDSIYTTLGIKYNDEEEKRELDIKGEKWTNLDSVYIYNAAKTAIEWFNQKESRKSSFGAKFFNGVDDKKSVQVVWYEDCGEKDARDIFNEINDLTVKLSCSELIRSLFLSSTSKYECTFNLDEIRDSATKESLANLDKKNQQRYINTKWDEIEQMLSDKRIKAFITNTEYPELRNNIELLFDLISQKNVNRGSGSEKNDPLYTFLYFYNEMKESNATKLWKTIEECYSRICGWFKDKDCYHKIGYLNALRGDESVICDLLSFSESHSHREIDIELNKRIKESVVLPKNVGKFSDLSYDNSNHYDYIRRVLFLYNVELNRRMKTSEFFPFELFKPLKGNWTLEHIHAQNSDKLENKSEVWQKWAEYNAETIKTLHLGNDFNTEETTSLIKQLEDCANNVDKYGYKDVIALFNRVFDLYAKLYAQHTRSNVKSVHQLSNMALLSQSVNSAIGCSVFAVKRQDITKLRNNGEFFPIGTMNVFQKAYSKNPYLYEWSYEDRRSYMASIKWILKDYISKEIML